MSSAAIFRIGLVVWAVIAAASAVWVFTLCGGNAAKRASAARSRLAGGICGAAAIAMTVPLVDAILWDWLRPWYIPAAAVFYLLAVKYIDYAGSRGIAGLAIMISYYFLYYSFACGLPFAAPGCVFCWLLALWGIAVAGKPCWMRDQIMWAAERKAVRYGVSLLLMLSAVYALYGSIVL